MVCEYDRFRPEFRLLKVEVFFINLHNSQGSLFPPHGPELLATYILGKTDLIT